MGFLFDLPKFIMGPAIVVALVSISLLGLNWFRKHRMPRLKFGDDGDFGAAMVASIFVFYGLATALTAVQVWEAYEHVKQVNKDEAALIGVLYRNVSGYPEPIRTALREDLREYTDNIIHEAWPLQRKGVIPSEGVHRMDVFQSKLVSFEPANKAQEILALETLASYSRMLEVRRMRIDSVQRQLPGILWLVIVLGALISMVSTFYFPVTDPHIHRVQVSLLATFIGLIIFMIMALDRPYRGDLGLTPKPYKVMYEQLMSGPPSPH